MKITDGLKEKLLGGVFVREEIDAFLSEMKYMPIEDGEDEGGGVCLKYTNARSQVWVRCSIASEGEFLVEDVTMRTKKTGNTKVRAFRSFDEIKGMMDYFRGRGLYDDFLAFTLGILLARRIGDTLSLKWKDFYHENGRMKDDLRTLIEEKTGKTVDIKITDVTKKYIRWYCEKTGVNPTEHLDEDIFRSKFKDALPAGYTEEQYYDAISKQSAKYRRSLKAAADANGLEGISTHSTRKTFGYIAHEINKYDPDCLPVLQTIYGHSSIEDTKIYIDIMDEKAKKVFNDVAGRIDDIDSGRRPAIDNIPVVALKTNDLRDILKQAYVMGRGSTGDGADAIECMNGLLAAVDALKLS